MAEIGTATIRIVPEIDTESWAALVDAVADRVIEKLGRSCVPAPAEFFKKLQADFDGR